MHFNQVPSAVNAPRRFHGLLNSRAGFGYRSLTCLSLFCTTRTPSIYQKCRMASGHVPTASTGSLMWICVDVVHIVWIVPHFNIGVSISLTNLSKGDLLSKTTFTIGTVTCCDESIVYLAMYVELYYDGQISTDLLVSPIQFSRASSRSLLFLFVIPPWG